MDALRTLVRALRAASRDAERSHAVSAAQLFVLRELAAAPGLTLGALARRTHSRQSSVSEVVARLVDAGLVVRTTPAEDARRRELALTPQGAAIAAAAPVSVPERLLTALESLPTAARATLAEGLETWVDRAGLGDVSPAMFFEKRPGRRSGHAG